LRSQFVDFHHEPCFRGKSGQFFIIFCWNDTQSRMQRNE
jgi:hypothetical protein